MHHLIPLARMQRHHGGLVYHRRLAGIHVADYQSDDLRRSPRFQHHARLLFRESPCVGWRGVVEQRPNHALQRTRRCRLGRVHAFGGRVAELGSLGHGGGRAGWCLAGLLGRPKQWGDVGHVG